MRCLSPLVAWRRRDRVGVTLKYSEGDPRFPMSLPCGGCIACLRVRARQHAVRCLHEREVHDRACFVTLTYDEEHLPYAGSLVKTHFQDFVRAVRVQFGSGLRFFGCGEYGARWQRPHYHLILFGVDFFQDRFVCGRRSGEDVYRSPCLEGLWPMGRSEVGSAGFQSAAYVAGYVSKKLGSSGLEGREPEFLLMSLKPGIGVPWLERNYPAVMARDSVVVDGVELPTPRMYDKWFAKYHPEAFAKLRAQRQVRRLEQLRQLAPEESRGASDGELYKYGSVLDPDARSSRWEVIEEVMLAKLNRFSREVEV